jgi:hypothetical protein
MHKKPSAVLLLAGLVASSIPLALAGNEPITQEELVRRTQELFDAVVPGNQEPWKKYYADDCLFADEKGRQMDKTKLIADISPMPKGYSGTIKVVKPESRIIGDTAILSYDCDETETVFGQHLTARYHATEGGSLSFAAAPADSFSFRQISRFLSGGEETNALPHFSFSSHPVLRFTG